MQSEWQMVPWKSGAQVIFSPILQSHEPLFGFFVFHSVLDCKTILSLSLRFSDGISVRQSNGHSLILWFYNNYWLLQVPFSSPVLSFLIAMKRKIVDFYFVINLTLFRTSHIFFDKINDPVHLKLILWPSVYSILKHDILL